MEELNFFTTYAEYEFWLIEHKEVLLPYFIKNDVPLKSLQMNVRAYNALRINNILLHADNRKFVLFGDYNRGCKSP